MKKHYLLAAAVATLLATGCQKDQELVTLGAEIDQPKKHPYRIIYRHLHDYASCIM